ncbi:SARP family transcriptional regulator [Nocardioides gansuensis]|uniref:SARP family transcriptional regulator n=1 Tax=Nocardioides gansuensis TaxID=2138300 RepID=A0A2T8FC24_9ACTN|nr:BTAD domain-containing putative transcriptional regulator [Nocardioides gansuensis]PVG83252.1 SARP family transcriptional regulator [Nocardioides gansuensis]
MADLRIQLLGPHPLVSRDGGTKPPPRGRKAWALLAYLTLTRAAPTRQWLAELLFSDAADPLNALSWNLSQLRSLLGPDATLGGDPVVLTLAPGSFVDAQALTASSWRHAMDLPGLGCDLLQDMPLGACPGFEAWLLAERRRLAAAAEDVLREAARARLAAGDGVRTVDLAGRLVAANPLDEDAQELLIRGYLAAGDRLAAEQQRDACVALFRRELGAVPGIAVLHAADGPAVQRRALSDRAPSRASTVARLEAGVSSAQAGASDTAIRLLRQAVDEAESVGDPALRIRARAALGSALVHAVRGRDGEGAQVLLEAIALADLTGTPGAAAQARRDLGYVELLRGRYDRARRWLDDARELSGGDGVERAWTCALTGVVDTDLGRHERALAGFAEALELARAHRDAQVEVWALTFAGRVRLLRRDLAGARASLTAAIDSARSVGWTAFVPLPESLLAEVDLLEGDLHAASGAFEHAHAMAVQLDDPCWEGMAGRGLGLVAAARGDISEGMDRLADARTRCVRVPDAYLWIEGYCLDALCGLAVAHDPRQASQHIDDLEALAARTGMRELVARAYAHRGRLGDQAAAEAAQVLAAEVDNPALTLPRSR